MKDWKKELNRLIDTLEAVPASRVAIYAAMREFMAQALEEQAAGFLQEENPTYPGFSPDEVSAQYTQGWHDAKLDTNKRLREQLKGMRGK